MTSNAELTGQDSLTSTLGLALTQCQDQVRHLTEQSKIIDKLRQENERLRREIEALKTISGSEVEAKYASQFQDVFQKMAEKQAEVDKLKTKLRDVKFKARSRGLMELDSSSPYVPQSVTNAHTTKMLDTPPVSNAISHQHVKANPSRTKRPLPPESSKPASRKRSRSTSPTREPLEELHLNGSAVASIKSRPDLVKSTEPQGMCVAGLPELAEDGDDHSFHRAERDTEKVQKPLAESVYRRLGNLLHARTPATPVLSRARSTSPPVQTKAVALTTPITSTSASFGLPTPRTDVQTKHTRLASGASTGGRAPNPEDDEPFRSRPVNRLGLKHFKINPAANSGIDYAYNEVVRGQQRKCFPGCTRHCCVGTFRTLTESMPGFQGPIGRQLSDLELLRDYLGPGSEARIDALTSTARENLIHEARTKLMANAYGKMHRNAHQRGRSPPGFWRTDMPGSQEQRTDHEAAKVSEREEVLRRYDEAMKGSGQWIFADE